MKDATTNRWAQRVGRLAILAMLVCVGCKALPTSFAKNHEDQTLRKQVEADRFPSAKQVGL
ncbi:MAG: hypothetical protein ABFC77_07615 [Thermoguttaceae bacterium]